MFYNPSKNEANFQKQVKFATELQEKRLSVDTILPKLRENAAQIFFGDEEKAVCHWAFERDRGKKTGILTKGEGFFGLVLSTLDKEEYDFTKTTNLLSLLYENKIEATVTLWAAIQLMKIDPEYGRKQKRKKLVTNLILLIIALVIFLGGCILFFGVLWLGHLSELFLLVPMFGLVGTIASLKSIFKMRRQFKRISA